MTKHLLAVALLAMISSRVCARLTQAEFVLSNQLSESIQVEARDKSGKTVSEHTVKAGGEIALRISRRIVVQVAGESREYALPSRLYLWSPQNRLVAALGGKWKVTETKAPELGIQVMKAPSASSSININKAPLTFPMHPRKASESFEQYQALLKQQYKEARAKGFS